MYIRSLYMFMMVQCAIKGSHSLTTQITPTPTLLSAPHLNNHSAFSVWFVEKHVCLFLIHVSKRWKVRKRVNIRSTWQKEKAEIYVFWNYGSRWDDLQVISFLKYKGTLWLFQGYRDVRTERPDSFHRSKDKNHLED